VSVNWSEATGELGSLYEILEDYIESSQLSNRYGERWEKFMVPISQDKTLADVLIEDMESQLDNRLQNVIRNHFSLLSLGGRLLLISLALYYSITRSEVLTSADTSLEMLFNPLVEILTGGKSATGSSEELAQIGIIVKMSALSRKHTYYKWYIPSFVRNMLHDFLDRFVNDDTVDYALRKRVGCLLETL